jgi:hypothetical protein
MRLERWVLVVLALANLGHGAATLSFTARGDGATAVVGSSAGEVCRVNLGDAAKARAWADQLAARLNAEVRRGTGLSPWSLTGPPMTVMAGPRTLVEVTPELAEANETTPELLGVRLLGAVCRAFSRPYLCATAPPVPLDETVELAVVTQPAGGGFRVEAPSEPLVDIAIDPSYTKVRLTGRHLGKTTLTLVRDKLKLAVPIEVLAVAARLRHEVQLALTGTPSPALLREALEAPLAQALERQPGVTVRFSLPARLPKPPFDRLDVSVNAAGPGCLPLAATVPVKVQFAAWRDEPAARLLLSTTPTKVESARLLARGLLPPRQRTRLLWHHVHAAPAPLVFEVRVVNPGDTPARVHLALATAGPSHDELYCGHKAMLEYWRLRAAATGQVVTLAPRTSLTVARRAASPTQIVSGVGDLTTLEGGPAEVHVVAAAPEEGGPGPRPLPAGLTTARDAWLCEQPLLALSGAWRQGGAKLALAVGEAAVKTSAGAVLKSALGVEHRYALDFENPGNDESQVEFVFSANGGVARGVFLLDDDVGETLLVKAMAQERLFDFPLPPGGKKHCRFAIIPQAGSGYPVRLYGRPFSERWSGQGPLR